MLSICDVIVSQKLYNGTCSTIKNDPKIAPDNIVETTETQNKSMETTENPEQVNGDY